MNLLNIIDNIYENSHFTTALIASVVILVLLFIIVLIIGMRDARKDKSPKRLLEEDIKDVSFDIPPEAEKVKEDVTFEMPVLTKNLENFKKSLEEEIQSEEVKADVHKKTNKDEEVEEKKVVKVLDMDEIKDTSILDLPSKIEKKPLPTEEKNAKAETNEDPESIYDLDDDF